MTEPGTAAAPGWWQASDFTWYPPALHPDRNQPVLPTVVTPSVRYEHARPAKRATEHRSWWRRTMRLR